MAALAIYSTTMETMGGLAAFLKTEKA